MIYQNFDQKCYVHIFHFRNLKDYMEDYCLLDVYLLAEVFMQFRLQTLSSFQIDPCHFISLPGLGFECFLKKSNAVFDALTSGKF